MRAGGWLRCSVRLPVCFPGELWGRCAFCDCSDHMTGIYTEVALLRRDTSPHFFIASNHKVFTMLLLARVWCEFWHVKKSIFCEKCICVFIRNVPNRWESMDVPHVSHDDFACQIESKESMHRETDFKTERARERKEKVL